MAKTVDVAIVGAGSAGLAALEEVRKVSDDFILIDDGPLGTMCARAGCMPSKALIQVANEYDRRLHLKGRGIHGGNRLRIEIPEALAFVRKLRDRFMRGVVHSTKRLGHRLIRGRARFAGPGVLRVGREDFHAKRIILATGSRPVLPMEFKALGNRALTTESLFELEDLPKRIGVVGLGSVGLELGQALSRLGCDVVAFDSARGLGRLSDPAVDAYACRHFAKEFEIHFDSKVKVKAGARTIQMTANGRAYTRDMILASLGRRPNFDFLGLDAVGIALNDDGFPEFDAGTQKLTGLPIFIAGDADGRRPMLHEALDDGRIAGYNSVRRKARRFDRRAPLAVTFCEPNIALVGETFAALERGTFVTGEASFETDGRSLILGEDCGLLHVYAAASGGKFLGAEMIGPGGEHLAHLMAWSLQQKLTVFEMLQMPFYHPTLEESLRTALRDAAGKVRSGAAEFELA